MTPLYERALDSATEARRFADNFARPGPYAGATSNFHESNPMLRLPIPHLLTRHAGQATLQPAERSSGLVVAAVLAASIALALSGCSTPVAKPAVKAAAKKATP